MKLKRSILCVIIAAQLMSYLAGCQTDNESTAPGDIAPQSTVTALNTGSTTNTDKAASENGSEKPREEELMYVTGSSSVQLFKDIGSQEVITELNCGEPVVISEEGSDEHFTFVSIPNTDNSGYVYNRYLVSDKNSVTKPFVSVIGENGAKLFAAEGGTGDVLGTLSQGNTVNVIAKTSGGFWRVVTGDSVVGYVNIMDFQSDTLPQNIDELTPYLDESEGSTDSQKENSHAPSNDDTEVPKLPDMAVSVNSGEFLESAVSTAQAQAGGKWSAAYIDLQTGASQSVGRSQMQAASLIKLYIMGAVYEKYDTYSTVNNSIDSLLYSMITVSDNSAANELVAVLGSGNTDAGKAAVTAYAQSHGYNSTSMGRLLLESNINGDNYTSADDCAHFLQAVYNEDLPHANEMMSLLSQQTVTYKIPAGVPVKTANKTGELDSVQNDAAVVYAEQPYVLCVMSENVSAGSAINAIVELSQTVYSSVSK